MLKWLKIIIGTLRSSLRSRHELTLEDLALRQQLVEVCGTEVIRMTASDNVHDVRISL